MSRTLASLRPGERGVVAGFPHVDSFAQRLMQLGFLEGTTVTVLRQAPTGDPIEVELMGYALSLRLEEARAIPLEPPAA
ncbi:MAG: ferrous iron transport protein A [Gammaproteobacteria bacterium]